jgi:Fungal protein kinase
MAKQESGLACAVEDTQKTSLFASSNSEGTFDNRIFRCLVVCPAGRAIYDFDRNVPSLPAIKELLEALHDAIKAHRSL